MKFPNKEIVDYVKRKFPTGTTVELLKMDDQQAPPIGTLGNVMFVDDTATIHVAWENGSTLGVVFGVDVIKVVENEN